MPLQNGSTCYVRLQQQQRVKLTSVHIKNRIRPHTDVDAPSTEPTSEASEHLICLSSKEVLMLFQLLQASLLHPPMRESLMAQGEYSRFHRQLSASLGSALAGAPQGRSSAVAGNGN